MPRRGRSAVLGNHLDQPDDVQVELLQVLGGDPVLQDGLAAGLLDFLAIEERLLDLEAGDTAAGTRTRAPDKNAPAGRLLER